MTLSPTDVSAPESRTGSPASQDGWQFWVDRGGTFTDIVARRPDGWLVTHKLLSENPEHYEDAALQGIREILGLDADDSLPPGRVAAVKMGTTVGTNALLERKGERCVLLVTRGFADALRIAWQNRPDLFSLNIALPELLYEHVIEVPERLAADGRIIIPMETEGVQEELEQAFADGIRSAAIVLMHGYRYPDHEQILARLAADAGFPQISISSEVSPLMKLVSRGDTTVVDAYLSPILRRYVDRVCADIVGDPGEEIADPRTPLPARPVTRLMFMQSNGGLTDARYFRGKDSILSGPAGGIVGAVRTSAVAGFEKIIAFDMGGTSTDVTHYDQAFERAFETVVAGVRIRAPMMRIHTVAAGGGSICQFDGSRYRVGPESAGASPGPASYRRGGPLTVTDCNVMLGKLRPEFFPPVFGPDRASPLDVEAVRQGFEAMAADIHKTTGDNRSAIQVAEGFLHIAVENMANAIKQISVQRGHDVTRYTLSSFGGAGGQHACLVADALGMTKVLIHPLAGLLSAYGMGLADIREMREKAVEQPLCEELMDKLDTELDLLAVSARDEVLSQGVPRERVKVERRVHIRYAGTDTALVVSFTSLGGIRWAFEDLYRRQFGFCMSGRDLIVEAVSIEVIGEGEGVGNEQIAGTELRTEGDCTPRDKVAVHMAGQEHETPVYDRAALIQDKAVSGPAIILEAGSTTLVEPGWQATLTANNHLLLERVVPLVRAQAIGTDADPVMLEVFNNLFMSIAEQMGVTLENTSTSVNIKERLDFSCALFDPAGNLVANAPHMPVHLGSMGASVRAILDARNPQTGDGSLQAGDVYVLNDPYHGGTHLPDITVITPVFDEDGKELLFWVASRGHHADIGGTTPGSMPPDSKTIEQEGVLLTNIRIVEQGELLEDEIRQILTSGPFPARNPDQNIADLKAQIAANEKGIQELRRMVEQFGLEVVQAYMGHVQDNAEEQVRRVIDRLSDGAWEYGMDNGAKIAVSVTVNREDRSAIVDFTGSSPQQDNNFNAPSAVAMAAVLYVFRTLVADNIPMNEGVLKPLQVILPEGSILNPVAPAAVVAGNVETSQVITDALYGALEVMACAQGTMNNVTFGNERHQYYETLCGGAGAGPGWNGCSAVHTHMTNSRLTDPEVLEWRYPVRVDEFCIRENSGGYGRYRGGDGVVRRIRFLEDMTASILSNRRKIPPAGMAGGSCASPGETLVERADGTEEPLDSTARVEMKPHDVLVIKTPGGGGYGPARDPSEE